MPCAHGWHVAVAADFCAVLPKFPASHTVPLHRDWSTVAVNVPASQSKHDLLPPSGATTIRLPSTHSDVHVCVSFAALAKNVPPVHVFAVHAELSVAVEYMPDAQGAHAASSVAVPAFTPSPAGQLGLSWS